MDFIPRPNHLRGALLDPVLAEYEPLGSLRRCSTEGVDLIFEYVEGSTVCTCQGDTLVEKVLSDPYPSRTPWLLAIC